MSAGNTHILVVEDEPPIIELLMFTMHAGGWDASSVSCASEAWQRIHQMTPDLVLLDWMLPDQSGLHLLSRIRSDRKLKDLPVIMLAANSMEEDKVVGLDNGADDYVTKPFSPRELTARVNALLRRKSPEHAQGLLTMGPLVLDSYSCTVSADGEKLDIGLSEFKLLKFLMGHPERVYSRSQLLDNVWGDHSIIDERTVDVYILRLRKALRNHDHLVKTVRGIGYILSEK